MHERPRPGALASVDPPVFFLLARLGDHRKEMETQGDLGEARRENWEDWGVGQTSVVCCCHP